MKLRTISAPGNDIWSFVYLYYMFHLESVKFSLKGPIPSILVVHFTS